MNKIIDNIIHFFRRLLFFITKFVVGIICTLIFILTYEPKKWKTVTKRKINRIRILTKFKLFLWKHFSWYIKFIHCDKYYIELEERFG